MFLDKVPVIYLLGGLVVLAMLAPLIAALIRGGFPKDRDQRVQNAFEGAAEKLGLRFELLPTGLSASDPLHPERPIYIPSHEPAINGQWRGRQIEGVGKVEMLRKSGSEFRHRPRLSVELLDERLENLRVQPRDKVGRLEKMAVGELADVDWGQPDRATGDARFDADFIVGGLITDEGLKLLQSPGVKDVLRDFDRDGDILWFEMRLGKLTVEIDFRGLDAERLVARIKQIANRARTLEQACPGRTAGGQGQHEFFPSC